jgi:hypothetical protein
MVVTYPVGGVAWDYLQYALGLEQLGFEVFYLEDTGWQVYHPLKQEYGEDCSYGVPFLQQSIEQLAPSLERRWCVRNMDGKTFGMSIPQLTDVARSADLFLNVSGAALLRDEYMHCPCKVLIETDPGWNHFVNFPKWDANPGWYGTHGWRAHDHFFTYAERIGQPDCTLPTMGVTWHPTRPPVLLDRWTPRPPGAKWTTVMTWNNFGKPIEHEGVVYGTKEREFETVETIPQRVQAEFEVACGGNPPVQRWRKLGWSVVDSHAASRTADDYRTYIEQSRGEFSVAKNVYVATRSGWFSCRSVCYLASGRPIVVQDTGLSQFIPCGSGVMRFETCDEAAAAVELVEADYDHHSRAARQIAGDFFDSRRVLGSLLKIAGLAA